jgi:hypothetical protein
MGDSLAQLYSLTFFNVLIPGAASRVNLAVSDRPRLALDRWPVWGVGQNPKNSCEHMFSALPSNSDIARRIWHVSKGAAKICT